MVADNDPEVDELNQKAGTEASLEKIEGSLRLALETQRQALQALAPGEQVRKQLAAVSSLAFGHRFIAEMVQLPQIDALRSTLRSQAVLNSRALVNASADVGATFSRLTAGALVYGRDLAGIRPNIAHAALTASGVTQGVARLIASQFTADIGTVLDRVARDFGDISARLQAQAEKDIRFSQAMMDLGWPPPPDIPLPMANQILGIIDDQGPDAARSEVEGMIVNFYTAERIEQKLQAWRNKQLLARRAVILEKAVRAHQNGDYELSVPALVAQVEGIIADGYAHVGRMGGKAYVQYVESHVKTDGTDDVEEAAAEAVKAFVTSELLAEFEHGKPSTSRLSRHAILHGADTDYAYEANSLKALLLIDVLQDSFRLVTLNGSNVYHLEGCPHIMRSRRRARHHKDESQLLADGKMPCRHCRP